MIRGVINSNSVINPGKEKGFPSCALCGSDFSVSHEGEMMSADTKTKAIRGRWMHKHKGYVDAVQRQRKLTSFCALSVTANLNKKVMKAKLNTSWSSK